MDVSDASKVHAGEVTSAAMLRTLLADSKRCKAVKGKGDEVSNDSGAMAVVASVHKVSIPASCHALAASARMS